MKAAIFEKPGLENLEIKQDIEEPKITDHDVLVRVRMCGVNPIDHMVTSGAVPIRPLPHIPGCEISGTIEGIGKHVKDDLHEGDRIIIHSRVFDGTCDMCLSGLDMLCRNGGIVSAITNGGFADYIVSEYDKVVEKVKDITNGRMADVVMNSVGIGAWESSFESVGINGRLVTFGGLTGADVKLNVQSLYTRQVKLIGSSRGTRAELRELINISKELKTKVWKRFKLDETKEAIQALLAKERDGRIMLEI